MSKWDFRFISLAEHIGTWSKDPSTKVGCVVVGPDREIRATGYNGLPRGVKDTEERLNNRPLKYQLICHAEENAIAAAARVGVSLKGCAIYVHPFQPCCKCARAIIQAGIAAIHCNMDYPTPEHWKEDFKQARDILTEAGVITTGWMVRKP